MSAGSNPSPPHADGRHRAAALPPPEVYEQEYIYWPWGHLLDRAAEWIVAHAPAGGLVLDYMCGTGYLLAKIRALRPDLSLIGCDISGDFVRYGRARYPGIELVEDDALKYTPPRRPDVVICTAGLHHLPDLRQRTFIQKVASELLLGAWLLLGEEVIRECDGARERAAAVLEMWSALLDVALERSAPPLVVDAAAQALRNDLLQLGEYKLNRPALLALLKSQFEVTNTFHTWPDGAAFGDWLFVCKRTA